MSGAGAPGDGITESASRYEALIRRVCRLVADYEESGGPDGEFAAKLIAVILIAGREFSEDELAEAVAGLPRGISEEENIG